MVLRGEAAKEKVPPVIQLRAVSFNLRVPMDSGVNAWKNRRGAVREVLKKIDADVIGTQEGVLRQLNDISADFPDYTRVGIGRDRGGRGEQMAVFFKTKRFAQLSQEHFWLSDTPEIAGSTSWGNRNRRMVTGVRLKDKETGREFYFWNTHFDHLVAAAREKSAKLVVARAGRLDAAIPVVLTGDFNAVAGAGCKPYETLLEGGFVDTWVQARVRKNADFNTFNSFLEPVKKGRRIDWILVRPARGTKARVGKAAIVVERPNGIFPSDHFPVVVNLEL
ncbi:MAG: endonuclease/exonuclease/phosphatase family protein [Puniceicoccales bacterium]|nr:endonuclease/exonuclease/phosphatase family protein [Puniceicoccales bacterium]